MKKINYSEVLSALAVVIGLVFVGWELRQNTVIQRVNATQLLAAEYSDALEVMAYEGEAACVYALGIEGLDNLNQVQRLRFFVMMFLIFRTAEQLHHYSLEGMVEPQIWRGYQRQLQEVANLPGIREWWAVRRDWFSDMFQAWIDDIHASGHRVQPQTYVDDYCK